MCISLIDVVSAKGVREETLGSGCACFFTLVSKSILKPRKICSFVRS